MLAAKDELFTRPSGGYTIARSVRLRSSASGNFTRTPASASNRQIWTWSAWLKRGALTTNTTLFAVNFTGVDYFTLRFNASNLLQCYFDANLLNYAVEVATPVWRDPSAWYHIVLAVDTTQATSTNRVKIYVNGTQQTVTAISGFSIPAQNYSTYVNGTYAHALGAFNYTNSQYFDGYFTEINFIDGQQLTSSSFGTTNAVTGVWQPAKYTGTYGTNGFYLNFSSNSTAAALGTDFSGNSNTWTVNNISVTAGTTYDSMTDVPTLTSATAANYAVINPLNPLTAAGYTAPTSTNGNLTFAQSSGQMGAIATIPVTFNNKFYWETTLATADINIGAMDVSVSYGVYAHISASNSVAQIRSDGSTVQTLGTYFSIGDVIGIAYDDVGKTIQFYKNNSTYGTAVTLSATAQTSTLFPIFFDYSSSNHITSADSVNFGQQGFKYTPPTGYVALNTYNLPTSTITNGAAYMAATTYTGAGGTQSVTNTVNGISFQPDFVWGKARSAAYSNALFDSVRGFGSAKGLVSNLTQAEGTTSAQYGYVSTNTSTGFTATGGTDGSNPNASLNESGVTYVAWQWKAGTTSSSNTNGSITSTVSAGATQGFSVVTYTGNEVAGATVGHGLGATPSMIIVKRRDGTAVDWAVYHASIGATKYLTLNTTAAEGTSSAYWNNTAPTSSVFSLYNSGSTNANPRLFVAYCFAPVAGYSAFGSYTGNGSTDGPFVYCGFRPRWIMIKQSSASGEDWTIYDSARNTYNSTNSVLYADTSSAEFTSSSYVPIDLLSNGFKIRTDGAGRNASSATYIYAVFAENPFKNALAR